MHKLQLNNQNEKPLASDNYIKGLISNDNTIIREIYKNYLFRIEKHIISRGGTADDAKDVFQDGLMVIYNKAKKDDFELTSSFYTYLFGICYYIWERKRRNNSRVSELPESYEELKIFKLESVESDILYREKHKIFRDNFTKLGTFCKQILQLFFTEKSMNEIADELNLKNAHTARNRKYRCQKELEKLVFSDKRYEEFVSDKV